MAGSFLDQVQHADSTIHTELRIECLWNPFAFLFGCGIPRANTLWSPYGMSMEMLTIPPKYRRNLF